MEKPETLVSTRMNRTEPSQAPYQLEVSPGLILHHKKDK
jgi:hypothetical protein